MGNLDDMYRFTSDAFVYNFSDSFTPLAKEKIFKETTLYSGDTKSKTQFWKTKNSIALTKDQEAILKQLDNK